MNVQVKSPEGLVVIVVPAEEPTLQTAFGVWATPLNESVADELTEKPVAVSV